MVLGFLLVVRDTGGVVDAAVHIGKRIIQSHSSRFLVDIRRFTAA